MKKLNKYFLILALLVLLPSMGFAQERAERILSLSTFIPAPRGYFHNLTADEVVSNKILLQGRFNVGDTCDQDGVIIYDEEKGQFKMCAEGKWTDPSLWQLDEDTVTLIDTAWILGIGTLSPAAKLHAKGGFLLEGDSETDITFPLEGSAGTRLFWHPKKGALFSGYVDSDYDKYWNEDGMGSYSVAIGSNVRAPGQAAAVLGGSIHDASADYSAILGGYKNTISSGGSAGIIIGGRENTAASLGAVIIAGEKVTIPKGKDYSLSIGRPITGQAFSLDDDKTIVLHADKVGINVNPEATLHVKGSIMLGNDKEKGYATRSGENVYIVGGYVNSSGSLVDATSNGISASRTSTGIYTLNYSSLDLYAMPFLSFTPINSSPILSSVTSLSKSQATVKFYNASTSVLTDVNFMFYGAGTLSSTTDGANAQSAGFNVDFGQ